MQVTETNTEGLKREYTVVVPAADFESKFVARLMQLGGSVAVPGFRPGKVPVSLLKSRYGDTVRGEILEQTVQDSWQKAIAEQGLRPAMEPKIEIVKFEEGTDLEYKLAVELLPDIEPVDFSKISFERLVVKLSDEEIDKAVEQLAEQHVQFEPVKEERAAAEGDQLVIDFIGRVDGEEFAGGTVDDFVLHLGTGTFVPGFEEQMVGAEAGSSREIKVSMPEDYPSEALRGKEVVFDVAVKEVREAQPPVVDDALAKTMGSEDLAGLKATIRDQMEREYAQICRLRLKRVLLDQLADTHDFALPEGVVEQEFEVIWQQVSEAMEKDQLDEDDKGKSEDELREGYHRIAQRRVRLGLLLAEVGRANNITVSQEDTNRAMHQEAARFPGQEAKILEYFQNNPAAMQDVQAPIFEDKVVDFIIEMANITDREIKAEDLLSEPEESAAAEKPTSASESSEK